ncbi:hypothetical protein ACFPER_07790 [Agromyces aurantiacus]|uniref:Uncharacterized protein n=1 Tax=Agromyces aurantiacus TaxID=165814 RepID=A0ABV9R5E8_9MICO|nr:hypothetical protein [Agromyces aurantiacus]MBM7503367.1 hypothetical protein [Agromyces aurantiacus]
MSTTTAPYDGPEGLWNADPIELATALFRQAFAPLAASPLPEQRIDRLPDDLAALGGFALGMVRVRGQQPGAMLLQLALECVLVWERAGIAARESTGTNLNVVHVVVMLRMGVAVLASPDPEATVRQLLGR